MFEIAKEARLSEEAKILFNIQEILKEMNSKLGVLKINKSQSEEDILQATEVAKEVIGEVLSNDEFEHFEQNDKLKKKKE